MNNFIVNKLWYKKNPLCWLLLPLAIIYSCIIFLRRLLYQCNIFKIHKFSVPVIIVGNITVGGTGKTPLTIWLVNYLLTLGFKPGIVSRGYGGKYSGAFTIEENSDASITGDEALIIHRHTKCPVIISKNRVLAVKKILADHNCDIIISDDGLQHYALGRNLEIIVIDGQRRFGNGLCLPAGPLRESKNRLKKADFVIINDHPAEKHEHSMQIKPKDFCNVAAINITKKLSAFKNQTVHAVAGIGNPQRFFALLQTLGLNIIEHPFPDHHFFKASDLDFKDDLVIIMTEKDAVKCQKFANAAHWFLRIEAQPDSEFIKQIGARLSPPKNRRTTWQSNLIYGLGGW
jgi:tetraacyldisaccharide 4'-kinase